MNLTRKDCEDGTIFASVVNKNCDDFKLSELSANNFKCLIFVQGLVSACSSHRSISLRELMPPPSDSAITDQSPGRAH